MSLPISSSNATIVTLVVKLWHIFCTWLLTEEILKDIFFVIVEIYRRLYLKKNKTRDKKAPLVVQQSYYTSPLNNNKRINTKHDNILSM